MVIDTDVAVRAVLLVVALVEEADWQAERLKRVTPKMHRINKHRPEPCLL